MSTVTLPPVSWQEALENHLPEITARLRSYFGSRRPELREEMIQEGLTQLCMALAAEAAHGRRSDFGPILNQYWGLYTKRAAHRVFRGCCCTRPVGRNADTLDRSHFAFSELEGFERTQPDHSQEETTVRDWVEHLPDWLQDTARYLLADYTQAETADRIDRSPSTVHYRLKELREHWLAAA